MIHWEAFTPISALFGGLLIGLSAALLILVHGRIAGISGILGGVLSTQIKQGWRIAFLLGLILSSYLYALFHSLPPVEIAADDTTIIMAGLLVGMGTRLGSGCTSGHGVCGIARLSKRSIMATLTFMATGIMTVYIHQYFG